MNPRAPWPYLFPLALAAALLALWLLRRRLGKGPLVAILFFIVTLSPILGFVDFSYMGSSYIADRFQYLAGIGPLALLPPRPSGSSTGPPRRASSNPFWRRRSC